MGGYVNHLKIAQLYADAESLGGQTVTVAGWVRSVRDMKNWLCYAQRRQLLPRPAGRHEPRGTRQLRRDRPSKRLGRTHLHRHRQADPRCAPAFRAFCHLHRGRGRQRPGLPTAEEARNRRVPARSSTCVRAPTCFAPCSASALSRLPPSTASSRSRALSTSTPPSSPRVTARAPARCSRVTTLDPKNPPLTESGEVD